MSLDIWDTQLYFVGFLGLLFCMLFSRMVSVRVSVRIRLKPKFHLARHVTSRHDTFDVSSPCIFWLCRPCRTARLDTLVSTHSTRRTCRVETWRDEPSGILGLSVCLESFMRT